MNHVIVDVCWAKFKLNLAYSHIIFYTSLCYRLYADDDISSLRLIDFGNALRCVDEELALYYEDFQLQTLLYRAPEVMTTIYAVYYVFEDKLIIGAV